MTDTLVSLIEQHKREIWEWKQKESQWIRDKNQLDGNKQIIEELSTKLIAMKKRAQEAEGETILVKGIGINSPEMKEAREINKLHQELNGNLRQQLELEKKNHAITREDVQLKDLEIGRMMEKIRN